MRTDFFKPKPKLKPGVIYSGDNGSLICVECAGMSAKYTGRDLSGHRVSPVPIAETVLWHKKFGEPMRCEGGCTTYLLPSALRGIIRGQQERIRKLEDSLMFWTTAALFMTAVCIILTALKCQH